MLFTNLSDRSYETTKLLRRSKGVFSKTRRTLTSPPQFRIARLSGPEGFPTTALFDKRLCNRIVDYKNRGAVIPAHNCKCRYPDAGTTPTADWKPSPHLIKGNSSCKRTTIKKQFLPGRCFAACPFEQYISDRRPRGLSLQQLVFVACYLVTRSKITLKSFLNGTVGYRTDSEDSIKSPGCYSRIRTEKCKIVCDIDAVIPDICLERRSTSKQCTVKTERTVIPF
jgi:hypothetical protein